MIIRTVLDLRPRQLKYQFQTILLAASWHVYGKDLARLEIFTIGTLPEHIRAFFDSIGAHVKEVSPNPNDSFSKTSNTIQGANQGESQQVLLLDNDVVFTNSIQYLDELDKEKILWGGVRRVQG